MHCLSDLFCKANRDEFLTREESLFLYRHSPLSALMAAAHQMRLRKANPEVVTWIIDRNVNTTNVCVANCKFCNFYRVPGHSDAYITSIDTYKRKIEETFRYGGEQLLLQGGHHPDLGLDYYTDLFRTLKRLYPALKLHALGPPEVAHICKRDGISHEYALRSLMDAGLDSLPGAGAEILSEQVRRLISKGKCSAKEWLDIMRVAHRLRLTTSATMMFGHVETIEDRIDHLLQLRQVQAEKPDDAKGFVAFIPWPFQDEGTLLARVKKIKNSVSAQEYCRTLALSRLMLPNIANIQASWLTVGKSVAQMCLHGGANDFGSIMIEENVVSAAGAQHRFTYKTIQEAIEEAGFQPRLRNQQYEFRPLPAQIQEQKAS